MGKNEDEKEVGQVEGGSRMSEGVVGIWTIVPCYQDKCMVCI